MERREELRGGGLWITGALNRANRRVPLTNLYSLRWPGAGSNRRPSDFQSLLDRERALEVLQMNRFRVRRFIQTDR